ncbi:MAG: hypothetical protein LPK14_03955, partial [Hymenobacteraceae bacterium]|nr:hypothetical protein [Hymenobacteraceae bacterium]
MSSAANHKRGLLEEEFQRRMQDAEVSPSPDLWARIDHDLTMQENAHYKRRLVLYRQLAAACFVLFMLAGALLTYHYGQQEAVAPAMARAESDAQAPAQESGAATSGIAESNLPGNSAVADAAVPAISREDLAMALAAVEQSIKRQIQASAEVSVAKSAKAVEAPAQAVKEASVTDESSYTYFSAGRPHLTRGGRENTSYSFFEGRIATAGGAGEGEERTAFESLQPFYQTA